MFIYSYFILGSMAVTFTRTLGGMPFDGDRCWFELASVPEEAGLARKVEGTIWGRGPGSVNLSDASFTHNGKETYRIDQYPVDITNVLTGGYLE
jgi:hypothetical protein